MQAAWLSLRLGNIGVAEEIYQVALSAKERHELESARLEWTLSRIRTQQNRIKEALGLASRAFKSFKTEYGFGLRPCSALYDVACLELSSDHANEAA